jgi:AhpD family alkylhydroperoxidase
MTGLPLIEPETADGETADLLAAAQRVLGITSNLVRALANSPAALRAYLGFSGALRGGSLPPAVCEQIALLVAQQAACDYCLSAHSYTGTRLTGLSQPEAARARRGEASEPLAASALAFGAAVLRGGGRVTDVELATARRGGLTDGQLAEVVAHVALGMFASYFAEAARVDIDWPLVRHAD